ncbi:ribosomal protein L30/L7E [Mycolicibacterium chubuense NBB4]|uniref:Ribosomal protein L30/L7E n=1 Tax=Mycolicibacterium chubuense (strain NBB4) TaxID=710421 RepID=I4BP22_MYCCN|nr:uL30 family ribosomal protein [Mycolicibacterium chubuense]AFM19029.1 ribosomal protein L30/L7E [Mycolicibacterium chubuense NBB4]
MSPIATESAWDLYRIVVAEDTHSPNFRGRLGTLPLPRTAAFERVAGRAGNAIVIQVKSGIGMRDHREQSLASLGLRGIDSAALVDINLGSTRGNIAVVHDAVRVITLKEPAWKQTRRSLQTRGGRVMVEHIKYGSSRQPGDLLRTDRKQYWYAELSRRAVSMAWSTSNSASDTITSILESLGPDDSGTGRIIRKTQDGEEIGEGSIAEVIDSLQESDGVTVEYVQVCLAGLSISWKQPFKRFVDSREDLGEIAVSVPRNEALRSHGVLTRLIASTATSEIKAIDPLAHLKGSRSVGYGARYRKD